MNLIEQKTSQIDHGIVKQLEDHCEGGRLSVLTKMDEITDLLRPMEFRQVRMGLRDAIDAVSYE